MMHIAAVRSFGSELGVEGARDRAGCCGGRVSGSTAVFVCPRGVGGVIRISVPCSFLAAVHIVGRVLLGACSRE